MLILLITIGSYLAFNWEGMNYVFTVLPFGLSTSCYIFTKIVRPLARYWRARGLRILVYLDDGLFALSGKQSAIEASQLVQLTLDESGFVTYPTKSIWQSSQQLIWLGFVVDVGIDQIEVPIEKVETLRSAIQQVSHATRICARKLASIVGQIISMSLAFGPVSRFRPGACMHS